MIGILAEKPSQARNFAQALGGMSGTFQGQQYVICPARGHLYGFVNDPSAMVDSSLAKKYSSWDVKELPWNETDLNWQYTKKQDAAKQLQNIKSTFSGCDEIVIGTDDDPTGEGELLAWEILSQLKIQAGTYSRMFFADESEKEVQKAFLNRKVLGHNLSCMYQDPDYRQALFRTKWDYLSMQWTRIATSFSPMKQVPRQGRLKSAMVQLVGEQLDKVKNYVRKPFYAVRFEDENGVTYSKAEEDRYDSKDQVPIGDFHASAVVCDSKTKKKTSPPKFLDLAALGGRLAGVVPAKTVLETYQKMYEAKVVSYPRTEDKCITPEQFNELLPKVDAIAALLGVDPSILTCRQPRKTHVKTGMAHGANRPGPVVPSRLDTLDAQYGVGAELIYTTLARNYLATLCEDYEYEQQKGHVQDYPDYVGLANVPLFQGWKVVYNEEVPEDGVEAEPEKGLGTHAEPDVFEGANPKPSRPTMRWLMKQLEKHDVGTGATRTSIYADVTNQRTKYPLLKESRGVISMAPNGETSYLLLPGTHIGSLDMTERVMKQMKEIYDGKTDGDEFLHEIQQMIREDIETMRENSKKNGFGFSNPDRYEGMWNGKKVAFKREWSGYTFSDEECEALCNGETIEVTAVSKKTGKPFTCKGKLGESTFNGKKFIGFQADFSAGSSGVPRTWCKHTFTDKEYDALVNHQEIFVKGLVGKSGIPFDAYLSHDGKKFNMNFSKK